MNALRWANCGVALACCGCGASEPDTVSDQKTLPDTPDEHLAGRGVYDENCAVCHDTSRDGAPRLGYLAAWKRRLAQGEEVLLEHALEGVELMPPRGDNPDLSDAEVASAVGYMAYRAELDIPAGH